MQVCHRRLPAGLCIEARGADGHTFVEGDVVIDLGIVDEAVEERALGGTRIAEDAVDPVCHEAVHEDLTSAHSSFSRDRAERRS
jgi:hypothetical protein